MHVRFVCWIAAVTLLALPLVAHAQDETPAEPAAPKAEVAWTLEGFEAPESICYDFRGSVIYVSNVAGAPDAKDGSGWISKVDTAGKMIEAKWVDGLNAPKGMQIYEGTLWVADIDEAVAIDMASGKVANRVKVDGATFLNDVAIDSDGNVYIADTFANKIWLIRDGNASEFASGEQLEAPNGLVIHGEELVVAGWGSGVDPKTFQAEVPGRVYALDLKTKEKSVITSKPLGSLDGLDLDGNGGHFVSDWITSSVYRVTAEGVALPVVTELNGPADLGVVPDKGLLVVPLMLDNKITAYTLKSLPGAEQ